jgi:capsular polysaccharide transport system ATP-binding protein
MVLGRRPNRSVVLEGLNAQFGSAEHHVIFGAPGTGKTTLLRLLAGVSIPSAGAISRRGSVSLPIGAASSIALNRTGREFSAFLADLYGADRHEVFQFAKAFSKIDDLDVPLTALRPHVRARLNFALGYAIPCDYYLFENQVGYGDSDYKSLCLEAFEKRRRHSGTIVAARSVEATFNLGERGGVLHNGQLYTFANVSEAADFYRELELQHMQQGLPLARALLQAGREDAAREHLTSYVVRERPDEPEAYNFLSGLFYKCGNYALAEQAASATIERTKDSVNARMILAKICEADGRLSEAIDHLHEVLRIQPDNREARSSVGKLYEQSGRFQEAAKIWHGTSTRTPETVELNLAIRNYFKAKNWDGLLSVVNHLMHEGRYDRRLSPIKARALLQLKKWQDAKAIIEQIARNDLALALEIIFGATKDSSWEVIVDLLQCLTKFDLSKHRTLRALSLILTFLQREARKSESEIRPEAAETLWHFIATIDPSRVQARNKPAGELNGDFSGAEQILRELARLRASRPRMDAKVFAEQNKAIWAAAQAYLSSERPAKDDDLPSSWTSRTS